MPTYERFEELPVRQEAVRLVEGCEDFIWGAEGRLTSGRRDPLSRASISVSNNIAEGFERGSTEELLQFLYIARGSAGEVRSMPCFFERRPRWVEMERATIAKLPKDTPLHRQYERKDGPLPDNPK